MRQESEVIKLLAKGIKLDISDNAEAERYTFGVLYFEKKYRAALLSLAKRPAWAFDGKTKPPIYEVWVLNHYYRFANLNVNKPVLDKKTGWLKVGFSSEDLIAVGNYTVPVKTIRK